MGSRCFRTCSFVLALAFPSAAALFAQTTAFTYQGRLTSKAVAATGGYDMQFTLFDAAGKQVGAPITTADVQVTNGLFTVHLNAASEFGREAFTGADRFLEVSVRETGDGDYTTLSPRQQITPVPYALHSTAAAAAGTFTGLLAGDVTGTQTSTTVAQINGSPLGVTTAASPGQVLAWDGAGWTKNGTFISGSGTTNTIPKFTGSRSLGNSLLTDDGSTLTSTGQFDVTAGAGMNYITAPIEIRTTQTPRVSFHWPGVVASQIGMDGTGVIRTYNNPGNGYEQFAASNIYANGFLSINSFQDPGGNIRFSAANPFIVASSYFVAPGGAYFNIGTVYVETDMRVRGGLSNDVGTFGGDVQVNDGLRVTGVTTLGTLGGAGATTLCRNALNQISTCSSSIRYKSNVSTFHSGLDLIGRLRPVSFSWKATREPDMGLVAEEVAGVEPLLVTYNSKGEVEGVKYDRVGIVLINALKEQQEQIKAQQTQLGQQQLLIEGLRNLVCRQDPEGEVCKPQK